jgi:hypothetical protein
VLIIRAFELPLTRLFYEASSPPLDSPELLHHTSGTARARPQTCCCGCFVEPSNDCSRGPESRNGSPRLIRRYWVVGSSSSRSTSRCSGTSSDVPAPRQDAVLVISNLASVEQLKVVAVKLLYNIKRILVPGAPQLQCITLFEGDRALLAAAETEPSELAGAVMTATTPSYLRRRVALARSGTWLAPLPASP